MPAPAPPEPRTGRRTDPDRALDAAAAGFAAWTAACHFVVLAGGGLDHLLLVAAAGAAVAVAVGCRRRTRPPRRASAASPAAPRTTPTAVALAASAAGIAAPLLLWLERPLAGWAVAVGAAGLAAAVALRDRPPTTVPPAGAPWLVWLLAAAAAGITSSAVRPDVDDALYLNLAVAAVDHPDAPLLAEDRMHGVGGVPLHPPTYRLHTLELLTAAAARLTGSAVIVWAHLVLPPVAAVLAVLAWARLARILAPRRWRSVLIALLAILVVVGNTHAWYANVGFVRLHQGKCVFATVGVPLLLAAAARLAAGCTRRRIARLAAAVVGGVGLTGSALWVAPALVSVGLVAGGLPRRGGLRPAVAATGVLLYPAVLGATMLAAMHAPSSAVGELGLGPAVADADVREYTARPRGDSREWRLAPMRFAVSYVLGEGALPAVVALTVAGLWWLSAETAARRLHAAAALVFLAVLFNPFLSLWMTDHVTGRPTYWRVFWVLPVPLLLALAVTAPSVRLGRRGPLLSAAATALLLAAVTRVPLLSPANSVELAPLSLKVPATEYPVARTVVRRTPAGAFVIAPRDVAAWIPTFHHHPHPLVVRRTFFAMLERAVDREDARLRSWASAAVEAPRLEPEVLAAFADALVRFEVATVVLPTANPNLPRLERALTSSGFERTLGLHGYTLWEPAESATRF